MSRQTVWLCFPSFQQSISSQCLEPEPWSESHWQQLLTDLLLRSISHQKLERCDHLPEERSFHAISFRMKCWKEEFLLLRNTLFLFLGHREQPCAISFSPPGTSPSLSGIVQLAYIKGVFISPGFHVLLQLIFLLLLNFISCNLIYKFGG